MGQRANWPFDRKKKKKKKKKALSFLGKGRERGGKGEIPTPKSAELPYPIGKEKRNPGSNFFGRRGGEKKKKKKKPYHRGKKKGSSIPFLRRGELFLKKGGVL